MRSCLILAVVVGALCLLTVSAQEFYGVGPGGPRRWPPGTYTSYCSPSVYCRPSYFHCGKCWRQRTRCCRWD
ncbi:hypothetical protein ScPMuIL_008397 [Solemya velum]